METLSNIKQEVKAQDLFGVMNDSRWKSVYELFQDTDLPFLYRSVDVYGEIFPIDHLRFDVREVFPQHFSSLMWLEVHSKEKENLGKLVYPKITDHTELAIERAVKAKARFTLTGYGIKIWGYVKQGDNVEFYKQA